MREHLATLLPRLKAAVDRRDGWEPADRSRLDQALLIITAEHRPDTYDSRFAASGDLASGAPPIDPYLALAEIYGLDDLDLDLLLVATAPEVDATVALLFGLLRGATGPTRASVGLALELCGLGSLDARGVERLGASSALRRRGLLDVGAGPWLTREISVPERLLGHLVGADVIDPEVAAIASHPMPLTLEGTPVVAQAIAAGTPLVWVRELSGATGAALAGGAFRAAGLRCICVDLDRAGSRVALDELVRSCVREAALLGAGLVLAGADRLVNPRDGARGAEGDGSAPRASTPSGLTTLHEAPVPVVAVAGVAWDAHWPVPFPFCVDAPELSPDDRTAAWAATGETVVAGDGLAGLRLSPEAIAQTAAYARQLAVVAARPVDATLVRHAARRVSGSSGSAFPGTPGATVSSGVGSAGVTAGPTTSFGDLVLPPHVEAPLRRLVGWARHRDEALSRGSLLDLGHKGAGLAALFTGGPGTGKTLAAHVIADELGLELVQVDLSTIVDKYIGETEKNLERVFSRAESLNVVLFFDEADALFGRRTEVKDSHDRHANQEVAYLLQRMENFDGLTILATNLRGNLDTAFSRRLNFVVHFPDPDAATRRRLWRSHLDRLGPLDATDPIDVDDLAETIELAGGDIRNIVLAAGYDAAAAGHLPGMTVLRAAAVSEFQKLGRRPPDGLLRATERVGSEQVGS